MAIVETLSVRGGARLAGEVSVSGGKNAAVAVIPAALLADSPSVIENLPCIRDVEVLAEMLKWLGAGVELSGHRMVIDPTTISRNNPPRELACRLRASYYLIPVLLKRFGETEISRPGGCEIGARPIDQTVKGWRSLGVEVNELRGIISAKTAGMFGSDVHLDMPSVGATINTMLAAVAAEGTTTIHNAGKEPHIVDVANYLCSMGAYVKGAGTDIIRVRGGRPLHGSTYAVIPDQIETGTLMIAAAATRGDVTITGAIPYHMEALSAKLLEMGVRVREEDDMIRVTAGGRPRPINVKTQGYPGFPTDLQQPLTAMLTVAGGQSVVTENIYEARYRYVDELRRMGARIRVVDRVAIVDGVESLVSAPIAATDLRAGAAMVIASLMAEGTTQIYGTEYIRRGYENIDVKLKQLGARIEWTLGEREE